MTDARTHVRRHLDALRAAGVEFIPAPLPDDVLLYRECPRVVLTALPHAIHLGAEMRSITRSSFRGYVSVYSGSKVSRCTPRNHPRRCRA